MRAQTQYLLIFITLLRYIKCSKVVCTKWNNDIPITSEEISTIMKYIGDGLPIFNNASEEFDFKTAMKNYIYHAQNDNQYLNITEIIEKHGYIVETHEVTTSDGYILRMYRIVGEGVPIFLSHGILSSSDDWVTSEKERALALLLAALGFDVWLGNMRGNFHSRKHLYLSPECKEFWDFSWHEIGIYDLPAMIDHVLNKTNHEALQYIGHSQGTTAFFVMCSEKPEYNKKVSQMICLAAVAWMKHVKNLLLHLISPLSPVLSLVLRALGLYEFLPRNEFTTAVTISACGTPETATVFCNNLFSLLVGFDYAQINSTILPGFYQHYPAGCSLKQLVHFAQEVVSGYFRQFDYGDLKNLEVYGSIQPPEYRVEKITVPVYFFHAENDLLSNIVDVNMLISKLPNFKDLHIVAFKGFNHMDY